MAWRDTVERLSARWGFAARLLVGAAAWIVVAQAYPYAVRLPQYAQY